LLQARFKDLKLSKWKKNITYIQSGDREAWVDYPAQKAVPPSYLSGYTKRCPTCRGHGGWNLLLSAFPLSGKDNTVENRHLFSHMRATCHACSGHGWIRPDDDRCTHEFRMTGVSNKLTHFSCVNCSAVVSWDTYQVR
jgi:hypothetical protein